MENKKGKIPGYVRPVLWSYRIDDLDLTEDKGEIITNVLNYGDWNMVRWLFKIYGAPGIKNIILHPRRGRWSKKVLNFWLTFFDVSVEDKLWRKAVIGVRP